jgi:hypothetical protein
MFRTLAFRTGRMVGRSLRLPDGGIRNVPLQASVPSGKARAERIGVRRNLTESAGAGAAHRLCSVACPLAGGDSDQRFTHRWTACAGEADPAADVPGLDHRPGHGSR